MGGVFELHNTHTAVRVWRMSKFSIRPYKALGFRSNFQRYVWYGMYPRATRRRMNDGPAPIFPEYPPHDAIIIDAALQQPVCFESSLPLALLCVVSPGGRGIQMAHDMRPVCEYFLPRHCLLRLSNPKRTNTSHSVQRNFYCNQRFMSMSMSRNANANERVTRNSSDPPR